MLDFPPVLPIYWVYMAALVAVFAWVVCVPLMDNNMILSGYAALLDRLPKWIAYPLGGCPKCFSGQAAFWLFLYWNWGIIGSLSIQWALFVTTTIFFNHIISKWS